MVECIICEEIVYIFNFGFILLLGLNGFEKEIYWKLNFSYVLLFILV